MEKPTRSITGSARPLLVLLARRPGELVTRAKIQDGGGQFFHEQGDLQRHAVRHDEPVAQACLLRYLT